MRPIDEFYAALGTAIRNRREELKLTQSELSDRIGLSRTSVTNIERGTQRLLADQLAAVSQHLRISTDRLLQETRKIAQSEAPAPHHELAQMPVVARFVESALAELRSEDA